MPLQPLRFIHVANALIDHQLRDLGALSKEARSIALNATVASFERIVEACLNHNVDFLLLTGGTFDERDHSLKARITLIDGFDTLDEAGIQVFVVPGPHDPASAWRALGELPANVTVFDPTEDELTAIMRDDTVIATLESCAQSGNGQSTQGASTHGTRVTPLRVGVIAPSVSTSATRHTVENWLNIFGVDYLAVGAEYGRLSANRGSKVGHGPGPAVPQSKRNVGPHGCSLVTVDEQGRLGHEFLCTSTIRRERCELQLRQDTSWDELIRDMRDWLNGLDQLESRPLLIVDWTLKGLGTLHDSLGERESQQELFELLAADTIFSSSQLVAHRLELATPLPEPEINTEETLLETSSSNRRETEATRPAARSLVGKGFFMRLDESHAIVKTVLEQNQKKVGTREAPWLEKLEALATRVDEESIAAKAKKLGVNWFVRIDPAND